MSAPLFLGIRRWWANRDCCPCHSIAHLRNNCGACKRVCARREYSDTFEATAWYSSPGPLLAEHVRMFPNEFPPVADRVDWNEDPDMPATRKQGQS